MKSLVRIQAILLCMGYVEWPVALVQLAELKPADAPSAVTEAVQPSDRPATGQQPDARPLQPLSQELQDLLSSGTPLNPEGTILLDRGNRRVMLRTQVVCNDCLLEMLCCREQTKEHESILSLRGQAFAVHAALLALNLKPGSPATFSPKFEPPTGPVINIFVNWVDASGKLQRQEARTWMRHSVYRYYSHKLAEPPPGVKMPHLELRFDPFNKEILWYGPMTTEQRDALRKLWDHKDYQAAIQKFFDESQSRPMKADFVFAGSYHHTDPATGENSYAAEGGDLICVANFSGSLIDVREVSSASQGGQSYEAWSGKVPPNNTPVIVELIPADNSASEKANQP